MRHPSRRPACPRRTTPAWHCPCTRQQAKDPQIPHWCAPPNQTGEVGVGGNGIAARKRKRSGLRGGVDVADLAAVGLVGLDEGAGVGVPEADDPVLAAAQAVVPVPVESHRQDRPLVPRQHPRLRPRQPRRRRRRHLPASSSFPASVTATN